MGCGTTSMQLGCLQDEATHRSRILVMAREPVASDLPGADKIRHMPGQFCSQDERLVADEGL